MTALCDRQGADTTADYDNPMSHDYTALDPNSGPTVWAKQSETNQHTIIVRTGSDPEDPMKEMKLATGEIDSLVGIMNGHE
jgi:hypothetical protein